MFYENQSSGTNAEIAATVTGFGGAVGQFAKGAKAGVTALGIFGAEEAFEQKTGLPSFNPVSLVRNFKSGAGFVGSVTNALKSLFVAPVRTPHKNSLDFVGETDVYRIKGPDGTFKIGESAQ